MSLVLYIKFQMCFQTFFQNIYLLKFNYLPPPPGYTATPSSGYTHTSLPTTPHLLNNPLTLHPDYTLTPAYTPNPLDYTTTQTTLPTKKPDYASTCPTPAYTHTPSHSLPQILSLRMAPFPPNNLSFRSLLFNTY